MTPDLGFPYRHPDLFAAQRGGRVQIPDALTSRLLYAIMDCWPKGNSKVLAGSEMAQSNSQVNFRCPVELKKKLDDAASSSTRSLNAEIVHRLQESFVATTAVKNVASDKKALKEAVKEAMREMQEIESQVTAAAKTRSGRTSDKR